MYSKRHARLAVKPRNGILKLWPRSSAPSAEPITWKLPKSEIVSRVDVFDGGQTLFDNGHWLNSGRFIYRHGICWSGYAPKVKEIPAKDPRKGFRASCVSGAP